MVIVLFYILLAWSAIGFVYLVFSFMGGYRVTEPACFIGIVCGTIAFLICIAGMVEQHQRRYHCEYHLPVEAIQQYA